MSYADVQYYREEFGGEFDGDDTELVKLLETASLHIDGITLWKTCRLGAADAYGARQRDAVRRACCLQADYLRESDAEVDGLRSFKVFDASVTYAEKPGGRWFCAEAALLLRGAGLVERVVS